MFSGMNPLGSLNEAGKSAQAFIDNNCKTIAQDLQKILSDARNIILNASASAALFCSTIADNADYSSLSVKINELLNATDKTSDAIKTEILELCKDKNDPLFSYLTKQFNDLETVEGLQISTTANQDDDASSVTSTLSDSTEFGDAQSCLSENTSIEGTNLDTAKNILRQAKKYIELQTKIKGLVQTKENLDNLLQNTDKNITELTTDAKSKLDIVSTEITKITDLITTKANQLDETKQNLDQLLKNADTNLSTTTEQAKTFIAQAQNNLQEVADTIKGATDNINTQAQGITEKINELIPKIQDAVQNAQDSLKKLDDNLDKITSNVDQITTHVEQAVSSFTGSPCKLAVLTKKIEDLRISMDISLMSDSPDDVLEKDKSNEVNKFLTSLSKEILSIESILAESQHKPEVLKRCLLAFKERSEEQLIAHINAQENAQDDSRKQQIIAQIKSAESIDKLSQNQKNSLFQATFKADFVELVNNLKKLQIDVNDISCKKIRDALLLILYGEHSVYAFEARYFQSLNKVITGIEDTCAVLKSASSDIQETAQALRPHNQRITFIACMVCSHAFAAASIFGLNKFLESGNKCLSQENIFSWMVLMGFVMGAICSGIAYSKSTKAGLNEAEGIFIACIPGLFIATAAILCGLRIFCKQPENWYNGWSNEKLMCTISFGIVIAAITTCFVFRYGEYLYQTAGPLCTKIKEAVVGKAESKETEI
jgi:DNA repair exonuclease SbcCD ATPase subunit